MKTLMATADQVKHKWYLIDASGKTVGRLSARVARILRGKHKPEFTPHVDTGDYVIIINANHVTVTGKKRTDKRYEQYTGRRLKVISFQALQKRSPTRILEKAIKGMLPKGPLGYAILAKLKVYADASHPHDAQSPEATTI